MRVFRFIVLLLSLAFAASSPGFAAEPRTPVRPEPARSAWVATLGHALHGFLTSLWGADGCFLDPLGRCTKAVATTDNFCGLDPLGRCSQAVPTTDTVCGIDPLGGCK